MAAALIKGYGSILNNLKERIRQSRLQASLAVNTELLKMYWEIGHTILTQQNNEGWGTKVIARLAKDLKTAFPDMKGLSERNLVYMQTFAGVWQHFPFTQAPLVQVSWYHHITLLDKVKDPSSQQNKYSFCQKKLPVKNKKK